MRTTFKKKHIAQLLAICFFSVCLSMSLNIKMNTKASAEETATSYISDGMSGYFALNTTGGSLYAPFDQIAVRTDVNSGNAGIMVTLDEAITLNAQGALVFDYYQMVVNRDEGISVSINENALKADAVYYVVSKKGVITEKTSIDGMLHPTVTSTTGFIGKFIVPVSSFSANVESLSTITFTSPLNERIRHSFGAIYALDSVPTVNLILNEEDKIFTPSSENFVECGDIDNIAAFYMTKGTLKGAKSQLTSAMVRTEDQLGTNYKMDPMVLNFPENLLNDEGNVDLSDIKGMMVNVQNPNVDKDMYITLSVIGQEHKDTPNAFNLDYARMSANSTNKQIRINQSGVGFNYASAKIEKLYEGYSYLPIDSTVFTGKIVDVGPEVFPTVLASYMFVNTLNNPNMCNRDITIKSVQWLANEPFVSQVKDNGVTITASYQNFDVTTSTTQFTYDVNYSIVVKSGYTLNTLTFNGEDVVLSETNTLTKSGLLSGKNNVLAVDTIATEYDIIYSLDGGTNNESNLETYTMESGTLSFKEPVKSGYNFGGWFLTEDFSDVAVTSIQIGTSHIGGITLYAKWVPGDTDYNITVSKTGNGSVASDKATAKIGEEVTFTITPEEGFIVKSALINGTQIKNLLVDGKYSVIVGAADIKLVVVFDDNEIFTVAQGASYFLVTSTKGSVYSPFLGVALRTDVAQGMGGMTSNGIQATLSTGSYIAFDYFQMVVNTNAGISVGISDGTSTLSLKNGASYYVQNDQGKIISKVITDGMVYPITSQYQGFCGRFIIPVESFEGSISNLTSITYSSSLVNRVRHSFGNVYVLEGFEPTTAITEEDVVWTAQADNYTKSGGDNVTAILLNAGEFVGAPANLTAESTNDSTVAQYKNDVMIISLPDEMKNENGYVSLEKVKGLVFDLKTTSKAKLFPIMGIIDSKYELNTLNGWQTRYANETNTWIWENGVISVNQSAVVIYPEYNGRIVIPMTQAAFSGTVNATGDTFPTEILPYIIVEPLNNPSICNSSVTIRSVKLVDDLAPYEACSVRYDGFNATVEAGLSKNYVLPGTEITFTVIPKIGFEFESATLNDEPITLNSDNTYTIVVTENLNFFVTFKAINYSITYELNGGTNNPENITSYLSTNATFDLLEPTKEGYVFEGWYVNEDFSGEKVTSILRGTSGDITLYAKWSKESKAIAKGCGSVYNSGTGIIIITLIISFGLILLLNNKKKYILN